MEEKTFKYLTVLTEYVSADVAGTCVRDRLTLVYGVCLQFNVDGHKEALMLS